MRLFTSTEDNWQVNKKKKKKKVCNENIKTINKLVQKKTVSVISGWQKNKRNIRKLKKEKQCHWKKQQ